MWEFNITETELLVSQRLIDLLNEFYIILMALQND